MDIEQKIIEQANTMCKYAHMDFPDYDEKNPMTTLSEALTVFVINGLTDDQVEISKIYDFLTDILEEKQNQKLWKK